jgi:hypothetical protein
MGWDGRWLSGESASMWDAEHFILSPNYLNATLPAVAGDRGDEGSGLARRSLAGDMRRGVGQEIAAMAAKGLAMVVAGASRTGSGVVSIDPVEAVRTG